MPPCVPHGLCHGPCALQIRQTSKARPCRLRMWRRNPSARKCSYRSVVPRPSGLIFGQGSRSPLSPTNARTPGPHRSKSESVPAGNRSKAVTSCPPATSRSVTCEPRKPPPPRTSTLMGWIADNGPVTPTSGAGSLGLTTDGRPVRLGHTDADGAPRQFDSPAGTRGRGEWTLGECSVFGFRCSVAGGSRGSPRRARRTFRFNHEWTRMHTHADGVLSAMGSSFVGPPG